MRGNLEKRSAEVWFLDLTVGCQLRAPVGHKEPAQIQPKRIEY